MQREREREDRMVFGIRVCKRDDRIGETEGGNRVGLVLFDDDDDSWNLINCQLVSIVYQLPSPRIILLE